VPAVTVAGTGRADLRRDMRARRRALSPRAAALASIAIVHRLIRLAPMRRARSVAGYWPVDGEPDVREALLVARARGAVVLLPVLSTRGSHMRFVPWQPGAPLVRNRYGIPEPLPARRRFYPAAAIDLVLAPLLAFDRRGHRLGQGGGYYDRAFAGIAGRPRPWSPIVGVAYEQQRVEELEAAPWDVPLSIVVTDRHTYRCRRHPASISSNEQEQHR
jgi:5-formyltetrahydrofolate cyclo-ligase